MTNEDLARALNHLFPEGGVVIHADGTFEVPGTIPTEDERQQALMADLKSLGGKVLACHCRGDEACHADVLK